MTTPTTNSTVIGWGPWLAWWALASFTSKLSDWHAMILCTLQAWSCWFLEWPIQTFMPMMLDALDLLPEEPPSAWETFAGAYHIVDVYIPLTEFLAFWSALLAFIAFLIVLRTILRFIPGMT